MMAAAFVCASHLPVVAQVGTEGTASETAPVPEPEAPTIMPGELAPRASLIEPEPSPGAIEQPEARPRTPAKKFGLVKNPAGIQAEESAQSEEQSPTPARAPAPEVHVVGPQAAFLPFNMLGSSADLDLTDARGFEMRGLSLRLGPVLIHGGLTLTSYATNNYQSNADGESDFVTSVGPVFYIGAGDFVRQEGNYVRLYYLPTMQIYAIHPENTAFNQALALEAQINLPKLKISPNVTYSLTSGGNADIGAFDTQNTFNASIALSYPLSPKISLSLTPAVTLQSSSTGYSASTYQISSSVNYQLTQKITLGLGPVAGISSSSNGFTQIFEGLQVSASYNVSDRFSLSGSIGLEARQMAGNNSNSDNGENFTITPIWSIGVQYTPPSQSTTFGISLIRNVRNTAFEGGQSAITTGIAVSVGQRFFQRIYVNLVATYSLSEFEGVGTFEGDRTDNTIVLNPSITIPIYRDSVALTIFYQYTNNFSTNADNQFSASNVGLATSISF